LEAKKLFLRIISVGAAILIISGGYVINKAFTGNTKFEAEEVFVYVPTDSKYEDVKKILAPYIENQAKIDWVASKRDYDSNVKAGKFLLKKGMSSFSIVRALRLNIPVKLAFNNQEKVQDLFVRIATKKGGEWLEKANQIKVYLKSAEQILSQVSGFIQDIEEKDFLSVYEKIKQSWNSIKPENDLIPNANWDYKLMAELYQVKNKAESWLANVLTGSRAGGQMTDEVKQIWSAIDSILTLSLTKHKIPDFSHLYKKNQFQVEYPEAEQLNSNQVKELIAIYSGGMKGEKNNILVTALNRVNQEIIVLGNTIDETYKATLASGGASAQVFIHAKQEFDAVMKKQKQIENVFIIVEMPKHM
jgi:hypothetical protein